VLLEQNLLAVSDRQDGLIFVLEPFGATVRARPWLTFRAPEVPGRGSPRLDPEGLAVDRAGDLLVLSEELFGVLRLAQAASGGSRPGSARASWLRPVPRGDTVAPERAPEQVSVEASIEELGRAAGFFEVSGAGLEGLTMLPDGALLLAVERQPRGLIELAPDGESRAPQLWAMPESVWPVPRNRPADFSDLTFCDGRVYALVRNAHLVVRLQRTTRGWREERAWSYAAAENDPRFVYADTRFGLGEGLAIGPSEVFVVLDNNGQSRLAAPADHRALLFRFARPSDL
jgi:hypothetical protein